MKQEDLFIEISVYDNEGNLVEYTKAKAEPVSQDQIDEMVSLIHGGMRAYEASKLVMETM